MLHLLYWWNFWEKFCKLYLDQDDALDALREAKIPPKMKKKVRPKGAKTTVIGLSQAKEAKRCYQ